MKNKRLQAILDCLEGPCILADIGTDHGYLPCEAIRINKAQFCYACDIAEEPLKRAEKTIQNAHMEDRVKTILCPGLTDVPKDADAVVIAGMGWHTVKMILENDFERLSQFSQIVIQVNREVESLIKLRLSVYSFNTFIVL